MTRSRSTAAETKRAASIPFYPAMIDLRRRLAVVIGGGDIAEQKVRALIAARAHVRVISPTLTPALETLATGKRVEFVRRSYQAGDLHGAFIAIAASDDRNVNGIVWKEAEAEHVLFNAVDDVEHCHFIAPSVHRQGDITVTVSTAGTCPTLAVRLRQRIGQFVGREHADFAGLAGELRNEINQRIPAAARRRVWYDIVDSGAIAAIRDGNHGDAREIIEMIVRAAEGLTAPSDSAVSGASAPQHDVPGEGVVYIIGAGPGDPRLITLRGLQLLCSADVIMYDGLVDAALLMHAAPATRLINVAKRGHGPSTRQASIDRLLVREAKRGRTVVRLKGGDPFVFGRATQEIEALRRAGVRFEVVPGVTSAVAAPAAVGIPVTSRAISAGFAVVTAAEDTRALDAPHASRLDWATLARIPTLVVMMGLRALPVVVTRLRDAGRSDDTPAAMISRATLPEQRVVFGTLASIAHDVAAARLKSPATLVVGDVVRLGQYK